MVKMNGALRAPPLTAPPGLALRSSRRASPKGACPPSLILDCGLVLPDSRLQARVPARLLNGKRILIPRNAVIAFLESCH